MAPLTPTNLIAIAALVVAAFGLLLAYRKHQREERLDAEAAAKLADAQERRLQIEAKRLTPMLVRLSVSYDADDRSRALTIMLDIDRLGFGVVENLPPTGQTIDVNKLHSVMGRSFHDLALPTTGVRFSTECVALWTVDAGDIPVTIAVCDSAQINTPLFTATRLVAAQA